jgi:hypothetical protein
MWIFYRDLNPHQGSSHGGVVHLFDVLVQVTGISGTEATFCTLERPSLSVETSHMVCDILPEARLFVASLKRANKHLIRWQAIDVRDAAMICDVRTCFAPVIAIRLRTREWPVACVSLKDVMTQ